ncbi:hypothetical protein M885DRAFT_507760 [Pelagophyceae sp. CCMP2097]|nr:hypothetical protein M885DRAFT_507760 [Pelagophyceae sp. CCMP2097]
MRGALLGSLFRSGHFQAHPRLMATDAVGVWNFAYGANMDDHKLRFVRKLTPLESVPAQLRGYRLAFNHNGGMGNLVPDAASVAHGVAHRLSPSDFEKLQGMEGDYNAVQVSVDPYEAQPFINAVAFVGKPTHDIADGLPPPKRYVDLLRAGAKFWNLRHLQWLQDLKTCDSNKRGPEYRTHVHTLKRIQSAAPKRSGRRGKPEVGPAQNGRAARPKGQS